MERAPGRWVAVERIVSNKLEDFYNSTDTAVTGKVIEIGEEKSIEFTSKSQVHLYTII